MKVVYIAGPYRAPTPAGIAENVHAAARWGAEVARFGMVPLVPHVIGHACDNEPGATRRPDQFWLDATRELLTRCDVLLAIHGWEGSEGTKGEIALAVETGIPVVYADDAAGLRERLVNASRYTTSQIEPLDLDFGPTALAVGGAVDEETMRRFRLELETARGIPQVILFSTSEPLRRPVRGLRPRDPNNPNLRVFEGHPTSCLCEECTPPARAEPVAEAVREFLGLGPNGARDMRQFEGHAAPCTCGFCRTFNKEG